jgi:hypothetical protein
MNYKKAQQLQDAILDAESVDTAHIYYLNNRSGRVFEYEDRFNPDNDKEFGVEVNATNRKLNSDALEAITAHDGAVINSLKEVGRIYVPA